MKPIEIYRHICEFTDKPSYEDLAGTCLVILRTALTSLLAILTLFLHLKSFLAGKHFNNDKELKENVSNWLKTQAATFNEEGIEKLVPRYDTCLQNLGSYVESDEEHFWLNGYVNKQKCHIWSEANPQEYVETPLHPEILTVWRTLWAGGILLQNR
ncbi:uncharacterized protein TNCV_2027831 [Trichonephila clavipes]|nr:uncharacterized protein TNCV_2027831 [Trichonephila clavipes]